jgi:hypothetical protein
MPARKVWKMSKAGRKAISDAQKLRWSKWRAAKRKPASPVRKRAAKQRKKSA